MSTRRTMPRILTDEEIDTMLDGDRRKVDRVQLTLTNDLAKAFVEFRYEDFPQHAKDEDVILNAIGRDPEKVRERREFVETLIERQRSRNAMMRKVSEGAAIWAVILFLGFLFVVFRDGIVHWLQDASATSQHIPK